MVVNKRAGQKWGIVRWLLETLTWRHHAAGAVKALEGAQFSPAVPCAGDGISRLESSLFFC